jgi:2-hydroxy-6-oxonona-2,4-dienedioate hydrolase
LHRRPTKLCGTRAQNSLENNMKQFLKRFIQIISIVLLLFTCLPYFLPVNTKQVAAEQYPYENSHFIISNKTKFHYRVWQPDTIKHKFFFIHGFSASTFSFRKNIDTLVKNGTLVIALDLPSFGFSDKSDTADYTVKNVFRAINSILDLYSGKIPDWNFAGHSMGAAVSGLYSSNFPEKISTLTLIDGAPFSSDKAVGFGNSFLKCPPLLRWADVMARHLTSKASFSKLLSSAYSCKADSESVKGYMIPFEYKYSGSAIFRMAAAQNDFAVNEENLKKVNKTIIWGTYDKWLPVSGMRDFLKKYPETKGYLIRGAGHCPHETHPLEVNKILLKQIGIN